jgi:thiol-disulfide isomerase/thioredoxin
MKQFILLIVFTFTVTTGTLAQGIQFLNDTVFENVLAKAKAENKLVFMDCYAVWCGPCKYMDANIFPDEALGAFHNANFINVKYDMEQPYGMKIRSAYGIKAYPSFLYLDGDGEVVHRVVGSVEKPEDFLAISKLATDPEKNFRAVNTNILLGDRRATTIRNYLDMNYGASNTDTLINEHFSLIPETQKLSKATWELMKEYGTAVSGAAFNYYLNNKAAYLGAFGKEEVDEYLYRVLSDTYRKSPATYESLKSHDEQVFATHQREMNFRKAHAAFSRDKANKQLWSDYIMASEVFINQNNPQPGFVTSIARTILSNYATFKDKASLNKALLWVSNARKNFPDQKELNTLSEELMKATGKKK